MKTLRWFALILALALLASFLDVPAVGLAGVSVSAGFGRPVGPSFVISDESTEELDPAVAYNSQQREYLAVFWNDRPGNDDIRAERVSSDGKLLGGFWVGAGAGHDRRYPDVAYNVQTNQYLVVWEDYVQAAGRYGIYGRLISATGQVISDEIIRGVSVSTPARPAVAYAYTSNKYLVVWEEEYGSPPTNWVDIVGQVVNSDGTLSGARFTISQDVGGQPRRRPDLAYNRALNGYLVVWQQKVGDYDIYARIVHPSGTPIGPDSFTISSLPVWEETMPTVAAMPTATSLGEYLVVWQSDDSTVGAVRYQLLTGDGYQTGPTPPESWYSTGAYVIYAVAGNENSQQFLLVMKFGTNPAMSAFPISSDLGQWGTGYWLDSGPGADHPAVASGPTGDFLVVFDRSPFSTRDIYGQLWGIRLYLPLVLRNY
jgi:hypothetical protein